MHVCPPIRVSKAPRHWCLSLASRARSLADCDSEIRVGMPFWQCAFGQILNTLSTTLAADERPARQQDRDLDETRTEWDKQNICVNSKHVKRWVGALHGGARTENGGCRRVSRFA